MNDDRNKFTFTMQNGDFQNTMTFRADTWPEALENFEDFMRGCGYVFTGNFDLVEEEKYVINEPEPLYDLGENDGEYSGWDDNTGSSMKNDFVSFVLDGSDKLNRDMNQGHPGVPAFTEFDGRVVTGWPFTSEEK